VPIKPENRKRYPRDWKQIRDRIIARAKNRCEGSPKFPKCRAANAEPHPVTRSIVVLTVGHLDHTPENCADENPRAWCQRCHLNYDASHHAQTAAQTRRAGRALGDLFK
jgi:hypothetical protein